jgi:hypothetical protein
VISWRNTVLTDGHATRGGNLRSHLGAGKDAAVAVAPCESLISIILT